MSFDGHYFYSPLTLTGIVGDEESRQKRGVLTSPNYPQLYPNNRDSTQTIKVAEGKIIYIDFTHFNTEREYDFVTLTDGDGTDVTDQLRDGSYGSTDDGETRLSGKYEDESSYAYIRSNIVHVHFHTDGDTQRTGWRLVWHEQ